MPRNAAALHYCRSLNGTLRNSSAYKTHVRTYTLQGQEYEWIWHTRWEGGRQ